MTESPDVLADDPEYQHVQRLAELRAAGWLFTMPNDIDDERDTVITGVHPWPDGSADLLVVRNFTAAHARRTNPAGGVVWRQQENLGKVVDDLLALPAPDDPGAPNRVIDAAPGLWTSG